jgi:hypothetical protein
MKKVESNKSQSYSIEKKPILGMKPISGFSKDSHDSVSFQTSMAMRGDSQTKIDEGPFEMQQSKRSNFRKHCSVDEITNPYPDSPSCTAELQDEFPSEFSTIPETEVPNPRSICFVFKKTFRHEKAS